MRDSSQIRHDWIIPAYAGSTASFGRYRVSPSDHPRIRGEHAEADGARLEAEGSSPHTRGAPPQSCRVARLYRDHPRIRGEHLHHHEIISCSRGSSPHTRGAHVRVRDPKLSNRIIPAYAGSTIMAAPSESDKWDEFRIIPAYAGSTNADRGRKPLDRDHPRIRGEHCQVAEF